jgi:predicted nuclease with RNAse H fold
VLTVGIDLAAEFSGTAVAWVDWSASGAVLCDLVLPADDDAIIDAVTRAAKAGIDCPLGWPEPFVSFVNAHRDGRVAVPDGVAGRDWRRRLTLRRTDEVVRHATGLIPMSVSADRIAHPAMRCAALLARLQRCGQPVDRCGGGVLVEVYPAASLKRWGLPHRGYKRTRNAANLGFAVDALRHAAPWLRLGRYEVTCRTSDHALDAVIAALTARAASLGLATAPDEAQAVLARTEGWIAVPTSSLDRLVAGSG